MRHHVQCIALVAALVVLGIAIAGAPGLREDHRAQIPPQVMADALAPEPEALRWMSLGHREAVADLLWLQAQSYAGLMLVRRVAHEHHLEPLVDGIIALDPNFYLVYIWAGTMLFLEEEIRPEAVLNASRYLRMGTERFPGSWRLHMTLAMNLWSELQLEDREALRAHHAEAATAMRRAAMLPGAPAHLHSVADRIARNAQPFAERFVLVEEALVHNRADAAAARQSRMMVRGIAPSATAEARLLDAHALVAAQLDRPPRDLLWRPEVVANPDPPTWRDRRQGL